MAYYQSLGHGHPPAEVIQVWIGKIPPELSDRALRELMAVGGGVQAWKRTYDRAGKLRNFGFAEYATPGDAIRAQALLSDLAIGCHDAIQTRVDEKTRKRLEAWTREHAGEEGDAERVADMRSRMEQILAKEGLAPPHANGHLSRSAAAAKQPSAVASSAVAADHPSDVQLKLQIARRLEQFAKERTHEIERRQRYAVVWQQERERYIERESEDTDEVLALLMSPAYRRERTREEEMDRLSQIKEEEGAGPPGDKLEERPTSIDDTSPDARTPPWDLLEGSASFKTSLEEWIRRMVVQYLESEEQDLIDFVKELVGKRTLIQDIVRELEPVFEEEAAVFAAKLWDFLLQEGSKGGRG